MTDEEFRRLIDDAYRKGLREGLAQQLGQSSQTWMPEACKYCGNNPVNGGSGICHCTIGTPNLY